jgi:hypothetical protein
MQIDVKKRNKAVKDVLFMPSRIIYNCYLPLTTTTISETCMKKSSLHSELLIFLYSTICNLKY